MDILHRIVYICIMLNAVKIKQVIKERGIKTNFVIDRIPYSQKTFYNYINGVTEAPEDFKMHIADVLGISVDQLD